MSSNHYMHLFDWRAGAEARKRFGDVIFDPFAEDEKDGDSMFLYGVELPVDPYVNHVSGGFAHQGAARWFDVISQEVLNIYDLKEFRRAREELMPFLSPKRYICDLEPPPACSFVPTIVSPEHAGELCVTLLRVDLAKISESDLRKITQRINPELPPTKNPYFREVSDLVRYLDMFIGLLQQASRAQAGVVSYFD